jgi:hypothetical protein
MLAFGSQVDVLLITLLLGDKYTFKVLKTLSRIENSTMGK